MTVSLIFWRKYPFPAGQILLKATENHTEKEDMLPCFILKTKAGLDYMTIHIMTNCDSCVMNVVSASTINHLILRGLTCAHLRTSFTVTAPGFAHRAAAHLLGEKRRQRVFAAPGLRHHTEALALLGWRL